MLKDAVFPNVSMHFCKWIFSMPF